MRQGRDESSDRLSGLGEILAQSHVLVLVGFGVYSTGSLSGMALASASGERHRGSRRAGLMVKGDLVKH